MTERMSLGQLGRFLEDHLLQSIVPFWEQHALDPQGGINTCIRDDGSIVSREKYMWSQLRAIYTFSALYNRIEKRQRWLDIAAGLVDFCAKFGRDDQGRWVFRVSPEGRILEGATSLYAASFALLGFTEFYRATSDPRARQLALQTFASVQQQLASGDYQTAPYPIPPGLQAHGVSMAFSLAFHELAQATGDRAVAQAALHHAQLVMDVYRRPQRKALLEFMRLDGSEDDSPAGRTVVPGHAIESMWFQIHQFQDRGLPERIPQCIECIRWHMELGWDQQVGGIRLGLDIDGKEPVYWNFADTKLWWPHTEALYALLLAYSISGEPWALDWYWKVHDIAFKHYPVPVHGEWTQRLDREFKPLQSVIALPVKDPFHLPRALILSIELLRRIQ